jgi:hypothetical protein
MGFTEIGHALGGFTLMWALFPVMCAAGDFLPYTHQNRNTQISFVFDLTDWDEYFFKPLFSF